MRILYLILGIFFTIHNIVNNVCFAITEETQVIQAIKQSYKRPNSIKFSSDNPYSFAKQQLGELLFFDPRLSTNDLVSCASCHNPGLSWTDGLKTAKGLQHKTLPRKTPSLYNIGWDELFFWDGRAESLLEQLIMPILNPDEMGMDKISLIKKLQAISGYKTHFQKAFPDQTEISIDSIAKALDIFVRKIVSTEAPFDKWVNGDEKAISEDAKQGFLIFNTKANCSSCHNSWRFSDGSFHDIGLADNDLGRGKILPLTSMQHAFKTTGLREIAKRAPYMHNGSLATLDDVIEHYMHGTVKRESLSAELKPFELSTSEKQQLIEFLQTLSSTEKRAHLPILPR